MDQRTGNRSARSGLRLLAALLSFLLFGAVASDALGEPPPAKDWEVEILPYAWLPSVDAFLEARGRTRHVEIDALDALRDVELGAMGSVAARWRDWLLVADGVWVRLQQEDRVQRFGLRLDADVDVDLTTARVLVGRRLFARAGGFWPNAAADDPRTLGIDALAGFDYVDLAADVEIDLRPDVTIERSFGLSETWISPAIGLRLQNDITTRIRLETLGTLGGFSAGDAPDFLWQLTTRLSYRFTDHWLVSEGHRLFVADDGRYEVRLQGATFGVGYRF